MVRVILLFIVFITFITSVPLYANKSVHLQEKCTEQARRFVEHLDTPTSYNCHYNKKLKKCFLCVRYEFSKVISRVGKTKMYKQPRRMVVLYDVQKGKMIGNCTYIGKDKQECWIRRSKCKTKEEFEKIICHYMEE